MVLCSEHKALVVTKAAGTWRTKQGTTAALCLFMPKFTAMQSRSPLLGKYSAFRQQWEMSGEI